MRKGNSYPYIQYMYSYPHKTAYGALKGVNFEDYAGNLIGGENSIYIHIPFCQYKCGYCNLFSVAGADKSLTEAYVRQMEIQAAQIAGAMEKVLYGDGIKTAGHAGCREEFNFKDLTIGGGTPLILDTYLLKRVFEIADKYLNFDSVKNYVIVETSPNQTTEEKLGLLKEKGVNRLSIGVESFKEEDLRKLKRLHSPKAAHRALEKIKKTGFESVNIDIIYGIPGQTGSDLLESLSEALIYKPEEIFIYPLYVKPKTPLYKEGLKPADNTFQLYSLAKEFLESKGYVRKSMRRFERGQEQKSTGGGLCGFTNTIAIGCGGRSYIGNLHFCAPYAVEQKACREIISGYLTQKDFLNISHGYILNENEMKRRYALKHLLYDRGINREDYREHFKGEAENDFPMIEEWGKEQYVGFSGEWIFLTDKGMDLSDYLGPKFISEEVARLMFKRTSM